MSKVYAQVTDNILDLMSKGQIPWVKPWEGNGVALGKARNIISGKPYRGINAFLTMHAETPFFCTYKQAQDIGAQVRKGEKSTNVIFWGKVQGKGDAEDDDKGHMFCRVYSVFNASQLDGLSDKLKAIIWPKTDSQKPRTAIEMQASAEALLVKSRADIRHENQNRAFYKPSLDYITMPLRDSFVAQSEYYSTIFHELGHWTGHESRLNRKELKEACFFGDHAYSQEELTAELTAAFVCSHLGISTESSFRNSAAYLQSWMRVLKNDSKLFCHAAGRAQKAADLIIGEVANG